MNVLDLIIILLLVWCAYKGFTKGLIYEVASVLALILGLYLAINFSEYVTELLYRRYNSNNEVFSFIAFFLVFIIIVIGIHFAGKLTTNFFSFTALEIYNKIGGALFGIIKGAILIGILFILIKKFSSELCHSSFFEDSVLYDKILKLPQVLISKMNFDFLNKIVN